MGRFSVKATIEAIDRFTRPVARMQRAVLRFTKKVERGFKRVNTGLNKIGKTMGRVTKKAVRFGVIGFGAISAGVLGVVREFSKIENATTSFIPLFEGSVERAEALVAKLNDTAATTPFQFEQLAESSQILLSMGAATEDDVIPAIRMLGDLAGGSAEKLSRMSVNFAEIQANGKAMTKDLRQFTTAGVPLILKLAEMLGKTTAEIQDMASKGQITSERVNAALKEMTSEGGKFFKGMELASKTTSGLWSTLADNTKQAAAQIGEALAPTIKELIVELTVVAKKVKAWAEANKEAIGQKFKNFVQFIKNAIPVVKEYGPLILKTAGTIIALIVALKIFIGVMTAVNLVMSLNPIGLIVIGIAALIAAIAAAIIWWDKIKEKVLSMSDASTIALGVLLGPIGLLAAAAITVYKNWDKIREFFIGLWEIIKVGVSSAIRWLQDLIPDWLMEGIKVVREFVDDSSDDAEDGRVRRNTRGNRGASITTPEERISRSIETSIERTELNITGAPEGATLNRKRSRGRSSRTRISLQASGAAG